ncbi:transglycosylase SLT domain-containing protein [Stakelama marina]|uniref:Transglycosylase SLT domain-containing protein n=1 Tax=Stakelama marina TaxID=2826939 RepID=A0A8T4IAG5_9SPHN|nr:transglycosylase SLT domain-containing protein [Stakelama marina]
MLVAFVTKVALLAGVSGAAVQPAQAPEAGPANLLPVSLQGQMVQPTPPQAKPPADDAALSSAIAEWKRLQQSDGYDFSEYANFLLSHPDWPGQKSRRIAAEGALDLNSYSPTLAVRFFDRFPPLSSTGRVKYAVALLASGQADKANQQARDAWRAGLMRSDDEARLMSTFPGAFTAADYDARMDELLWQGATSSAARALPFVSSGARPTLAARLAFRTDSGQASALDAAVTGPARHDAGFIADRATWLVSNGRAREAREYLSQPHNLSTRPREVEDWYEVLLANARGAFNDHHYQLAYDIAHQVDDAYPFATDVSTRPLGERDDYTSLVWLAGTTAMQKLNRPADAMEMFARYAHGSRTPQTQSKGLYWAGRAAQMAGKQDKATSFFTEAAHHPDLFYGQLAMERMGQPLHEPSGTTLPTVAPAVRQAFYSSGVVRAAQLLGKQGDHDDQTDFVRQIAVNAKSDDDHALAMELSKSINRPDLAVMIGRSARLNGYSEYTALAYPSVAVPPGYQDNWTMIHAIARQESQFDRAATSHAGARGLMQLMPATAREAAGKLGLAYSSDSLTVNPDYNIQLGSSYFQRMLRYYDGSYPLAVAAYNAGPGNVNKWIRANGDPRTSSVDVLTWIEQIPIYETKNYVQRVLENAVVYDLLNKQKALSHGPDNLSWYLGKNQPG